MIPINPKPQTFFQFGSQHNFRRRRLALLSHPGPGLTSGVRRGGLEVPKYDRLEALGFRVFEGSLGSLGFLGSLGLLVFLGLLGSLGFLVFLRVFRV